MGTLRTALRVVARHPVYLAIYVVFLTAMGVLVALQARGQAARPGDAYEPYGARVAVVDRDGSALSGALAAWAGESLGLVEVADEPAALQDALATGAVDCVIVVPEGFESRLLETAREGHDPDPLEVAYGTDVQAGALAASAASRWLSLVAASAALQPDASPGRLASLVSEVQGSGAEVGVAQAPGADEGWLTALKTYLAFSTYTLTSSIIVVAGVSLSAFNRQETRRRLAAAPLSPARRSLGVLGACLALVTCVWAWVSAVGLAVTGPDLASLDPALAALALLALLPFGLVPLSVAFLLSQLGLGEEAINACGNLGAMVMSFLGGAWVPIELLGEPVQVAARLSPTFWVNEALEAVLGSGAASAGLLAEVACDLSVVLLFAAAFLAVGLALGRARRVPA